jgi:septal ring factor EnvC (AmiA/AmiB activator)
LSESNETKLEAINKEIVALEATKSELRRWLQRLGLLNRYLDADSYEKGRDKIMELDSVEKDLNEARQKQVSYLLAVMNDSSKRLEKVTNDLQKSTEKLSRSSERLETWTWLLIFFAMVSAAVAIWEFVGRLFHFI